MQPLLSMTLIFFSFIAFDLLFFWVNQSFLDRTIRAVQGKPIQLRYAGAVLCYAALTALLYTHLNLTSLQTFTLGASVYAVYEGTNYAILANWPASMVVLDTLWGGLLFLIVRTIHDTFVK
jgi:uncharacterized membrane protein